jgi:hypothetical protein
MYTLAHVPQRRTPAFLWKFINNLACLSNIAHVHHISPLTTPQPQSRTPLCCRARTRRIPPFRFHRAESRSLGVAEPKPVEFQAARLPLNRLPAMHRPAVQDRPPNQRRATQSSPLAKVIDFLIPQRTSIPALSALPDRHAHISPANLTLIPPVFHRRNQRRRSPTPPPPPTVPPQSSAIRRTPSACVPQAPRRRLLLLIHCCRLMDCRPCRPLRFRGLSRLISLRPRLRR